MSCVSLRVLADVALAPGTELRSKAGPQLNFKRLEFKGEEKVLSKKSVQKRSISSVRPGVQKRGRGKKWKADGRGEVDGLEKPERPNPLQRQSTSAKERPQKEQMSTMGLEIGEKTKTEQRGDSRGGVNDCKLESPRSEFRRGRGAALHHRKRFLDDSAHQKDRLFAVERILSSKTLDGRKFLRIKWRGCGKRHNCWVPESDVFASKGQ
mmetsp:Transcript_25957/g.36782  ORF Transcript_25957/g.36782 Transcript_25957/m.36782 type:complete len:209 (+) Transcript_25957:3521-4147(+)